VNHMVTVCRDVHLSVEAATAVARQARVTYSYTTSTAFTQFLRAFLRLLRSRKQEMDESVVRLEVVPMTLRQ
jgi:hypothetical protein